MSANRPTNPLAPFDEALWRSGRRGVPLGEERGVIRNAVLEFESALTVWVLVQTEDDVAARATERLRGIPGVAGSRSLGSATLFRVEDSVDPYVFALLPSRRDGVV